jgi:uncharacterized protein
LHSIRRDTAILLFSRSAVADAVAKPLIFSGKRKSQADVAAAFIRHAKQVATDSGLPIFVVSGHRQHGATFGERFADAFRQVFERGFQRVIAIGNDCPALTADNLRAAAQKLDFTPAVFGPAADGGAYLVGLRREAFRPADFAALEWQTERTLAALEAYAEQDFSLLSEKADVDSAADLRQQLRHRSFPFLLKIKLLQLLQPAAAAPVSRSAFVLRAARLWGFERRGPPVAG